MPHPIPPAVLEFVTTMCDVGYDVAIQTKAREIWVRALIVAPCGCQLDARHTKTWDELEAAVDVNVLARLASESLIQDLAETQLAMEDLHSKADEVRGKVATTVKGVN